MSEGKVRQESRRLAIMARTVGRRMQVVDAILKGHAAGLTIGELVDLMGETEDCLIYTDQAELEAAFLPLAERRMAGRGGAHARS